MTLLGCGSPARAEPFASLRAAYNARDANAAAAAYAPDAQVVILNNEMYIGRLVWNRQRFVKDPDTGKRQARPNPVRDWITHEIPELRIITAEL